jgi:hypothetical protein
MEFCGCIRNFITHRSKGAICDQLDNAQLNCFSTGQVMHGATLNMPMQLEKIPPELYIYTGSLWYIHECGTRRGVNLSPRFYLLHKKCGYGDLWPHQNDHTHIYLFCVRRLSLGPRGYHKILASLKLTTQIFTHMTHYSSREIRWFLNTP